MGHDAMNDILAALLLILVLGAVALDLTVAWLWLVRRWR
jgi:hypothetical protein